jgi:hypothetical protein
MIPLEGTSLRTAESVDELLPKVYVLLDHLYDADTGLFPYSTSVENGAYTNIFGDDRVLPYTLIALLGMSAFAAAEGDRLGHVNAKLDVFQRRQLHRVRNIGVLGLWTLLSVETGRDRWAQEAVSNMAHRIARVDPRTLNMQELAWVLWGLVAAARSGIAAAQGSSREVVRVMTSDFLERRSFLPHHSLRRYRKDVVSFGSIAYFLRAVHEFAKLTDDEHAEQTFSNVLERVLALQGPAGEWPWLTSARSGRAIDVYPIFRVHQDSMSMLFLLPARRSSSAETVSAAIAQSYAWILGNNEISQPMGMDHPFILFRSIERAEHAPRIRRYIRSRFHSDASFGSGRVRINKECRSYELGWILYAWAGQDTSVIDRSGVRVRVP